VNKRNLIIQAAVAGLFTVAAISANATGTGSANGNTAQVALQAVTTASVIGSGTIQYNETAAIPAGSYELYVQLVGGAKFAQKAGGSVAAAALTPLVAGAASATVVDGPGTVSADQTFVVFPITITGAAGAPANTTTFTFQPTTATKAGGGITGVVAAASTSLQATLSLGSSASLSTTAAQSDEGTASTAPIIQFVNGITESALSSGLFTGMTPPATGPVPYTSSVGAEKATIDVINLAGLGLISNVNVAAAASSANLLDLGGFYFADVGTSHGVNTPVAHTVVGSAPFGADALTGFNIATDYATGALTATVSGPAGFFSPANQGGATLTGSVYLASSATCAVADTLATGTATISADGSSVSFSGVTVGTASGATTFGPSATGYAVGYVCVQAAIPNAVIWTPGQTYITATMSPPAASTVAAVTLAKTALYNLQSNGGSATVRSYIPAAETGYESFIRVINTGSLSANVSAAIISDTTGKTGIAGVIATAVPPGGAVTLPSSTIETAIVAAGGTAPAATSRPRLYVSAPTSITVQSFFLSPNGDFNEVSSGNNGGTSTDNQ